MVSQSQGDGWMGARVLFLPNEEKEAEKPKQQRIESNRQRKWRQQEHFSFGGGRRPQGGTLCSLFLEVRLLSVTTHAGARGEPQCGWHESEHRGGVFLSLSLSL